MTSAFNRWFVRYGFRIGMGSLFLIAFLYSAQKQNLQISFDWIFHSSEVQQELMSLTRSIELGKSDAETQKYIQKIQALTFDNLRQRQRTQEIHELLRERERASLDPALTERARKSKISSLNERVLTVIAEMRNEESSLLEEREKASISNFSLMDFPLVIGGLFAFFLIYMANRITRQDLSELLRKDEELQRQAHSLKRSKEVLERQTKILTLTMESMADGLIVINENKEIVQFNLEARQLLGFGPEALTDLKKNLPQLIRNPETKIGLSAEDSPLMRSLKGESITDLELETIPSSGPSRILSFSSRPIVDESGRTFGAIAVFRDVTDEKNLEDQLRNAHKAAEETAQLKSTFLANVSHEIRTPMNGIIGMTDLLKNTRLDEKQRGFLNLIEESCHNLLALVNDVLDFSKIEAGKLEIEKTDFNLADTVDRTVQLLAPRAQQRNLTLLSFVSSKIPEKVRGDSGRIGQILMNLLSNAIKFTNEGKVMVSADLIQDQSQIIEVRFTVEDTGIGIPPEKVIKLFQPFTQADTSTSRRYGETGLGLSICKQLVEMMAGQIGVTSTPGKGSVFWFTIPFDVTLNLENQKKSQPTGPRLRIYDQKPPSPALPTETSRRTHHILMAEDNIVNQLIAQSFLKELGYSVQAVANGKEVLESLSQTQFDLILMDCQMPEMDGFEATRLIRQRLENPIPIVALTANAMKGDEEKCKESGMNGYLSKPFRKEQLQMTLQKFLPKTVSVFDPAPLEKLKDYKDDQGRDLRAALIETFLETSRVSMSELEQHVDKDVEAFKKVAHTWKSSTAALGGVALAPLLERLELEDFEAPDRIEKVRQVARELENLQPALESYLKSIG